MIRLSVIAALAQADLFEARRLVRCLLRLLPADLFAAARRRLLHARATAALCTLSPPLSQRRSSAQLYVVYPHVPCKP